MSAGARGSLRKIAVTCFSTDARLVSRMLGRRTHRDPLAALTPRERGVLATMAEGKSNSGIAGTLNISEASVEKHVTAIFRKLPLAPADTEHRRVQAVLTYLRAGDHRR